MTIRVHRESHYSAPTDQSEAHFEHAWIVGETHPAVQGKRPASAGGLYHHFPSQDEVLKEGVRRHLARIDALRQVRDVLTNLGDLRAELTVVARFTLAELDNEAELFQILASEVRRRPDLLTDAADQLISSTYAGFADWLRQTIKPRRLSSDRARTIAVLAMGSLLSSRIARHVMGVDVKVDDEALIAVWVDMVIAAIG